MKKRFNYLMALIVTATVALSGFTPNATAQTNDGTDTVKTAQAKQSAKVQQSKKLPNIAILATGGTIAGTGSSSTQTTGYKSGDLAIDTLIEAVPEMNEIANISGEQIVSVDSTDISNDILLKLGKRINELLASDDVDGIVITHGTDTVEETAYFLNLVVKSDKPVVLTAAMRPATAMSADGPFNLYNAVLLASHESSKGKGVLVTLNDRISSARDVTKTNTTVTDAFKSVENGYLGTIISGVPYYYNNVAHLHTTDTPFDISKIEKLPQVDIIYGYQNNPTYMYEAAVEHGAKGIVVAAPGDGTLSTKSLQGVEYALDKGVTVVRSSRVGSGTVSPKEGFITSDSLNPQKARILLMLALTVTDDAEEIQSFYNKY